MSDVGFQLSCEDVVRGLFLLLKQVSLTRMGTGGSNATCVCDRLR